MHRFNTQKFYVSLKACVNASLASVKFETPGTLYSMIQKDGLSFVCLYFLNYMWYVNDLHNI